MDYEVMLDFHKENNADVTIATMPVPIEEASRFGIVIADDDKRINAFEEKPVHPRSNLASMGIYIFSWPVLKEALLALKDQENCDFGKHVIPYCFENDRRMFAYEFNGYWKDVGTLGSYWEANMELVDLIPEFNLYEEYWKIYTKNDAIEPLYIAKGGHVERSIMGEGCECYGHVEHSVIGFGTFDMEEEEIGHYFPEIFKFSADCRYGNCTHRHEPGCAVRKAVEEHYISESRYASYLNMLEDKEEGKYRAAY